MKEKAHSFLAVLDEKYAMRPSNAKEHIWTVDSNTPFDFDRANYDYVPKMPTRPRPQANPQISQVQQQKQQEHQQPPQQKLSIDPSILIQTQSRLDEPSPVKIDTPPATIAPTIQATPFNQQHMQQMSLQQQHILHQQRQEQQSIPPSWMVEAQGSINHNLDASFSIPQKSIAGNTVATNPEFRQTQIQQQQQRQQQQNLASPPAFQSLVLRPQPLPVIMPITKTSSPALLTATTPALVNTSSAASLFPLASTSHINLHGELLMLQIQIRQKGFLMNDPTATQDVRSRLQSEIGELTLRVQELSNQTQNLMMGGAGLGSGMGIGMGGMGLASSGSASQVTSTGLLGEYGGAGVISNLHGLGQNNFGNDGVQRSQVRENQFAQTQTQNQTQAPTDTRFVVKTGNQSRDPRIRRH
jgi:hypothetical protein